MQYWRIFATTDSKEEGQRLCCTSYGETFSIIRASRNDLQDALAEGDEYTTRKGLGRWLRKAMECVLCMRTARRQPVHGGKINDKIIRSN